jgi:hypothetical protein
MKETPILKIKLRLNNTTTKNDKVKKKHNRKSKNKNKESSKTAAKNGKSFYWTAERIETTKLVLRSVIVTN